VSNPRNKAENTSLKIKAINMAIKGGSIDIHNGMGFTGEENEASPTDIFKSDFW